MRFLPARLSRLFAALGLAAALSGAASADTIYLKNGRKITADHVVQENGQVSYETPSGTLSLPAAIVDRVVHEASLEGTAGTASDRAANLPIAPPSALNPGNDAVARAVVHDGSIDTGLLDRLESEASANPSSTAVARVVAAESAAAQFEISVGDFEQASAHYKRTTGC